MWGCAWLQKGPSTFRCIAVARATSASRALSAPFSRTLALSPNSPDSFLGFASGKASARAKRPFGRWRSLRMTQGGIGKCPGGQGERQAGVNNTDDRCDPAGFGERAAYSSLPSGGAGTSSAPGGGSSIIRSRRLARACPNSSAKASTARSIVNATSGSGTSNASCSMSTW